jgi:hypothetical protein
VLSRERRALVREPVIRIRNGDITLPCSNVRKSPPAVRGARVGETLRDFCQPLT